MIPCQLLNSESYHTFRTDYTDFHLNRNTIKISIRMLPMAPIATVAIISKSPGITSVVVVVIVVVVEEDITVTITLSPTEFPLISSTTN
ncbi:MAG: hypothetical protein EAX95_14880 [Candidatus Thorarchaeota archaeon]|nr:hypothetical protein [Candidatus Thorarchaeota archaeon]